MKNRNDTDEILETLSTPFMTFEGRKLTRPEVMEEAKKRGFRGRKTQQGTYWNYDDAKAFLITNQHYDEKDYS